MDTNFCIRFREQKIGFFVSNYRIIEEVIFKSCPTPLGKKQRAAPTDMKTNDRVEKIINDLFEFGVSIEVLFDVDDLVKAKNIPKVSSNLFICLFVIEINKSET